MLMLYGNGFGVELENVKKDFIKLYDIRISSNIKKKEISSQTYAKSGVLKMRLTVADPGEGPGGPRSVKGTVIH